MDFRRASVAKLFPTPSEGETFFILKMERGPTNRSFHSHHVFHKFLYFRQFFFVTRHFIPLTLPSNPVLFFTRLSTTCRVIPSEGSISTFEISNEFCIPPLTHQPFHLLFLKTWMALLSTSCKGFSLRVAVFGYLIVSIRVGSAIVCGKISVKVGRSMRQRVQVVLFRAASSIWRNNGRHYAWEEGKELQATFK